jgi:hypothetical protein
MLFGTRGFNERRDRAQKVWKGHVIQSQIIHSSRYTLYINSRIPFYAEKYRFHAVHQDLPRSSLCLRSLTIAIRVAEARAREPAKYIAGL